MKHVIFSLVLVTGALALATSAAFAAFSDVKSIDNNEVGMGNVTVTLTGTDTVGFEKPFSGIKLFPGQFSRYGRVVVNNAADSYDINTYFYVDGLSSPTCALMNVELVKAGESTPFYSGPMSAIVGAANKQMVPATVVNPGGAVELFQRVQLSSAADNSVKGTTCAWNEYFVGQTF